jgi:hypothetical protein
MLEAWTFADIAADPAVSGFAFGAFLVEVIKPRTGGHEEEAREEDEDGFRDHDGELD